MPSENPAPSARDRKLAYIDSLVTEARNGDVKALNTLLSLFDRLIYKISNRIHHRMHGKVSVEELHEAGMQEFRRLTLMDYIQNGRAHFNRYIESAVHAEVWKLYRPLSKEYVVASFKSSEFRVDLDIPEDIDIGLIASYATINLNQSERKIINDCVMHGRTGVDEAKLLGVSKVRVSQIKLHALEKLRKMLAAIGINRYS